MFYVSAANIAAYRTDDFGFVLLDCVARSWELCVLSDFPQTMSYVKIKVRRQIVAAPVLCPRSVTFPSLIDVRTVYRIKTF